MRNEHPQNTLEVYFARLDLRAGTLEHEQPIQPHAKQVQNHAKDTYRGERPFSMHAEKDD
jgi:hypothetical protein